MKYVDALQSFFHACNDKYQALRRGIKRNWPSYDEVNATHQPAWLYWFRHQWFIYPLLLIILPFLSIFCLQWGVNANNLIKDASLTSFSDLFAHEYMESLFTTEHRLILNYLILLGVYLALVIILNRFWLATALYSSLIIAWMVSNRLMVSLRNATVTLQDVQAAFSLGGGNLTSFLNKKSQMLISTAISMVIFVALLSIFLRLLFGKGRLLWFKNHLVQIPLRLIVIFLTAIFVASFALNLGTSGTWAYKFALAMDDDPAMWSTLLDAQQNGAAVSFARFINTTVMKKPSTYSQSTMNKIAERYKNVADEMNKSRSTSLTNQTVIMLLSESFADPTRVPGLTYSEDPMPFIRSLKTQTTSGLMLSSGYGGGTANLEYQALTGMSTAIFSPAVITPYLQVTSHEETAFSFNQLWNRADKSVQNELSQDSEKSSKLINRGSFAIHPYTSSTYSRAKVFSDKFLFRFFYTQDGPNYISQESRIENDPHISDASAYTETLHQLSREKGNQPVFVQLSTMQNHLPYGDWYPSRTLSVSGDLHLDDATALNTFARGIQYTDQATQQWLEKLDQLKRPVTVIWYGDHLPSNYPDEMTKPENSLILHETDYFIWSNNAARAMGSGNQPVENAAYTSPNYFMAQAAQHMNAKVSPYLAFLTQAHSLIPAIEPTLQTSSDWSKNTDIQPNTYLDSEGNQINTDKMSAEQKEILNDYKLIQYDMTVGNNYLGQKGWTTLPR